MEVEDSGGGGAAPNDTRGQHMHAYQHLAPETLLAVEAASPLGGFGSRPGSTVFTPAVSEQSTLFASPSVRRKRGTSFRREPVRSRTGGRYRKGKRLGEGATAVVYAGIDQLTGGFVAIKEVRLETSAGKSTRDELQEEFRILHTLSHPNIVRYYDYELSPHCLSLYMELVEGGTLLQLMRQFTRLSEGIIKNYFRQVFTGLEYLHANDVLHRDVKPGNMLIESRSGTVKLSDFGSAAKSEQNAAENHFVGTPLYAAHEAIRGNNTEKSDVWAAAVSVCELISGGNPWEGVLSPDNELELILKIGTREDAVPRVPAALSEDCTSFLSECLQRDEHLRPTCSELLYHPFFYKPDHEFTSAQMAHMSYPRMESFVSVGSTESVPQCLIDDEPPNLNGPSSSDSEGGLIRRSMTDVFDDLTDELAHKDFCVTGGLFIAGAACTEEAAEANDDEAPSGYLSKSMVELNMETEIGSEPLYTTQFNSLENDREYVRVTGTKDGLITVENPMGHRSYKFDIFLGMNAAADQLYRYVGIPLMGKVLQNLDTVLSPSTSPSLSVSPSPASPEATPEGFVDPKVFMDRLDSECVENIIEGNLTRKRDVRKRVPNLVSLSGTGVKLACESNMLEFTKLFLRQLFLNLRTSDGGLRKAVYVSSLAATLEKMPYLYDNIHHQLISGETSCSWKRLGKQTRKRAGDAEAAFALLRLGQLQFTGVNSPHTFVIELYDEECQPEEGGVASPSAGGDVPVPVSIMFINLFFGRQSQYWLQGLTKLVQYNYAFDAETRPAESPAANNPV